MDARLKNRDFGKTVDSFLELAGIAPISDIAGYFNLTTADYKSVWKVLDRRVSQGIVSRKETPLPGSNRPCIIFRHRLFDQGNENFDFESSAVHSNYRTKIFLELRKQYPQARLFPNMGLAENRISNQIESIDLEIPELSLEAVYLYDTPGRFARILEKEFYDFFYAHFLARMLQENDGVKCVVFIVGNHISGLQLRVLNFLAREACDSQDIGKHLNLTNSELRKHIHLVGRELVKRRVIQSKEPVVNGFEENLLRIIEANKGKSTDVTLSVIAQADVTDFCRLLQADLKKIDTRNDDFEW